MEITTELKPRPIIIRNKINDTLNTKIHDSFEKMHKDIDFIGRNKDMPSTHFIYKTQDTPEIPKIEINENHTLNTIQNINKSKHEYVNSIELDQGNLQRILVQQYQRECEKHINNYNKSMPKNISITDENTQVFNKIQKIRLPQIKFLETRHESIQTSIKIPKKHIRPQIIRNLNHLLEGVRGSKLQTQSLLKTREKPELLPKIEISPLYLYSLKKKRKHSKNIREISNINGKNMLKNEKFVNKYLIETLNEIRTQRNSSTNPVLRKETERSKRYRKCPLFIIPVIDKSQT